MRWYQRVQRQEKTWHWAGLAAAREAVIQARLRTKGPAGPVRKFELGPEGRREPCFDLGSELVLSLFCGGHRIENWGGAVSRGQVWSAPRPQQRDAEAWTD